MPNEPKKSEEKRSPPPPRENAQDNAEGSSHRPEEFKNDKD